ncbi:hypothetical protein ACFQZ4_24020 [Catellatospora coxensis]|uniref:Uncharacterized protein n=1 Tax=Catellatospora coxensis TaxID=310354 RepID=A0A8J3LCH4_9ACTN|nr:hypothetical protein [Catellatospora coxensis]GIG10185.1 hypothetical protein Cco03nite_68850 [Catellatospora coxensis]
MTRRRHRGGNCDRCGLTGYRTRAQAERACLRKGCHVRAVYRCGDRYHFDASTYAPTEER